jgi:hypothetical protein
MTKPILSPNDPLACDARLRLWLATKEKIGLKHRWLDLKTVLTEK